MGAPKDKNMSKMYLINSLFKFFRILTQVVLFEVSLEGTFLAQCVALFAHRVFTLSLNDE